MNAPYPTPRLVAALRTGTREHVLALSAVRILRHELYDGYPGVAAALGDRLEAATDAFIDTAVTGGHPMDWTLHLEYALHLGLSDRAARSDVCLAAARRWVRLDDSDADWIAVASGDAVAVGVRTLSPGVGPTVIRGRQPDGALSGFRHQSGTGPVHLHSDAWHIYRTTIHSDT